MAIPSDNRNTTRNDIDTGTRAGAPGDAEPGRADGDAGQATAEYALVLVAAAAVAGILLKWATGASGLVKLFAGVMKRLLAGLG